MEPKYVTTVDLKEDFWKGWRYLLRYRGIVIAIAIEILSSGIALHWRPSWPSGVVFAIVIVTTCLVLLTMRHYTVQRFESDEQLHWLFHEARDAIAKFSTKRKGQGTRKEVDQLQQILVEEIAQFFRKRTGNRHVNCAIRLADIQDGKKCYATRAWSTGMDPARKVQSKAIPIDEGLPRKFMTEKYLGAVIIPDIHDAVSAGFWKPTENDQLTDVRSVMAAPINSRENEEIQMLGILYITARDPIFKLSHTLPLKALADFLGITYPLMMAKS